MKILSETLSGFNKLSLHLSVESLHNVRDMSLKQSNRTLLSIHTVGVLVDVYI